MVAGLKSETVLFFQLKGMTEPLQKVSLLVIGQIYMIEMINDGQKDLFLSFP